MLWFKFITYFKCSGLIMQATGMPLHSAVHICHWVNVCIHVFLVVNNVYILVIFTMECLSFCWCPPREWVSCRPPSSLCVPMLAVSGCVPKIKRNYLLFKKKWLTTHGWIQYLYVGKLHRLNHITW